MSIELRPVGVKCNLSCKYCYQNHHREAGNIFDSYDIDLMKAEIEKGQDCFHIFGGEPLLLPEGDLEELFRWGYEKFGKNGIQTNGTLISEKHIEMFKAYKVEVGLSVSGPGELNDLRWANSLRQTRHATANTERALEMLCANGIIPGILIQVTKINCSRDRLAHMYEWIISLDNLGIKSVRLHFLRVHNEDIRNEYALSIEENIETFLGLYELEKKLKNLRFDIFRDVRNMLMGKDMNTTCVWRACDPYYTESVRGINGDGSKHNCGLTDIEGINFQKPDKQGYERYISLYNTPQEYGGCKGCRFFLVCKGHCPGAGMNMDWRNRTEYCEVLKALISKVEEEIVGKGMRPITCNPDRKKWEQRMLEEWARSWNPFIEIDFLEKEEKELC